MSIARGIHLDVSAEAYYSDPCEQPSLTQSIAKILLDKSPQHARLAHPRLNPAYQHDAEGYSPNLIMGQAAHALALGRGKPVIVMPFDSFRSKSAQETRDLALAEGKLPILPQHFERAEAMANALLQQIPADVFEAWSHAKSEVVGIAHVGDVFLRTMIDRLSDDRLTVWDLKTGALSCAPHAVGRKLADQGADVRAAMHELILDELDPDNAGRRRHLYVCVENEPPYAVTVAHLGEAWLTMGRKKLAMAIETWRRCMRTNTWPMYPHEVCVPEYPGYRETQWLQREISEEQRREPMLTDLAGG
jgi:hypothetical protein